MSPACPASVERTSRSSSLEEEPHERVGPAGGRPSHIERRRLESRASCGWCKGFGVSAEFDAITRKPECIACGKPASLWNRNVDGTYLHSTCSVASTPQQEQDLSPVDLGYEHPKSKVDLPSGTPTHQRSTWDRLGSSTWDLSTWDGEVLEGEKLAAWDRDPGFVAFVRERVGAGFERGVALAYQYAAVISGDESRLERSEFAQWKRRALIEGGFIPAPPASLAPLPESAKDATQEVWPKIELLLQCRVLGGTSPRDGHPLARRFLRKWTPTGEIRVRTAMEELERGIGYIRRDGQHEKGVRPTILWCVLLEGEEPTAS